jgi:hypothetical protein
VAFLLKAQFPEWPPRIQAIQDAIEQGGKKPKPNAALYTAIACIEAGVPPGFEDLFFILSRLPVWADLCK